MVSHVRTPLDSQDRTVSIGFPDKGTKDRACRTKQIGVNNEKMTQIHDSRGKEC